MAHEQTVILYHADCPDGFGSAFAAWKKFGEKAEYIPVKHDRPFPEKLEGRDLIFADFCYPKGIMDEIAKIAGSVTVIDHHEGVREVAINYPGIFDPTHSAAVLTWQYFHPDRPVPTLLQYVQEGDLYRFALPDSRQVLSYIYFDSHSFEHWEELRQELEDPIGMGKVLKVGSVYERYHARLVEKGLHHAELVEFEGYECYLASALGEFVSDVGNALAIQKPPLALVISAHADGIKVHLRSTKDADVAAIARKYGGNGHPQAAGFRLEYTDPIPWKLVQSAYEGSSH